jgi:hypothetical protein
VVNIIGHVTLMLSQQVNCHLNLALHRMPKTTHILCHRSCNYGIHIATHIENATHFVLEYNEKHMDHTPPNMDCHAVSKTLNYRTRSHTNFGSRTDQVRQCCTSCSGEQTTQTKSIGTRDRLHNSGHRTQSNSYTRDCGAKDPKEGT